MKGIIFSDLDKTLLDAKGEVSFQNRQAIRDALDADFLVCFISGRPYQSVHYLANLIDPRILSVGFHGAFCPNHINVPIPSSKIKSLILEIQKVTEDFILKTNEAFYCSKKMNPRFIRKIGNHQVIPFFEYSDFDQLDQISVYKVLVFYPYHPKDYLDNYTMQNGFTFYSYPNRGGEIISNQIDKGKAAKKICELYRVQEIDCLYFGDDINDLSMFALAGTKIAMKSALDALKQQAEEVISTEKIGERIKLWIEKKR